MRPTIASTVCFAIIYATSAALYAEAQGPVDPARSLGHVQVKAPVVDLDGNTHQLVPGRDAPVRAIVFLSTGCPIANAYTPTLNRLAERWSRNDRVQLLGIISDPTVTRKQAADHFRKFKVGFPVLFDSNGALARELKPDATPEAFVIGSDGRIVYRGKIDDAYQDLGRRRPQATEHYVADAVEAALAGRDPEVRRTEPVGCVFETLPEEEVDAGITYARHIAPIMNTRCVSCHRAGQVAPFAFTKYEDVAKRARQIARVTGRRIMPPWMPTASHASFVGDRRLSDAEIDLLKKWSQTGRARGNPDDLPPVPRFAEGWRAGKPDLILKMPEAFTVRADGPDVFQNFVIPIDVPEDKLVSMIEFIPGNTRVVHHAVLFLDDSGAARKLDAATPEPGYESFGGPGFAPSGAIGGWSVGNTPRPLPDGMGRYLKKGSDLVMQIHYHPTGREEVDQSTVGVYFVDKPIEQSLRENGKIVGSIWLANYEMDIPAGEPAYQRSTTYTLPREVTMVGVVPHMHLLGKSMNVTATLPDGSERTLVDIAIWDYNWQDEYYYEKPFRLPAGTVLRLDAVYDNSEDNPSNPNVPPRRVTWGDETTDEMLYCFFLLTADRPADLVYTIHHNLAHDAKQPRAAVPNKGK